MDTFADAVRGQEQNGTGEGIEPGPLAWVRHIEEVKAGLRDDPGRAYSVEFTAAAEILREHDPVQFHSLRRLLKDKQVRLREFDRLIDQRTRERFENRKRNKTVAAARISRTAGAIGRAPRTAAGGVQVGRYLANACGITAQLRSRRSRQYGACFGSTTKLAQSRQTAGLRPAGSGASLPPQRAVSA